MFFSKLEQSLIRAETENGRLQRDREDLKARIALLEAERTASQDEATVLRRERANLNGVFTSLGSFGDSLGGVRQSFFGLATTLNQEKASALEAASQSDGNRIAFEKIAANLFAMCERMTEASRNVDGLHQRAGEIGGIVQLIKEIADQTNLLALKRGN